VSDWERPTAPPPDGGPPRTYWAQPSESDPVGPGQLIRNAWRLYRSAPRRFLLVALVPELIRDLLAVPSLVWAVGLIQDMVDVTVNVLRNIAENPEAYGPANSQAFQTQLRAQLERAMTPPADLLVLSAVGGGGGIAIGLIGTSAVTAAVLAAAAGRPISVTAAFRLVAARGALLTPIIALGIGWAVVTWLPYLLQTSTDFQAWAGAPGSPRSVLLGSLLAVLGLIVTIGIIVLGVRWAFYIPAVLAEGLGVGPGLARAAQLSRGIRIRLGLAMAGIFILQGLSVWILGVVVGVAVGLSTSSVGVGFVAYLIASLIGSLLWAPFVPAMLGLAYRHRAGGAGSGVSGER
jgi:hypothetical protein